MHPEDYDGEHSRTNTVPGRHGMFGNGFFAAKWLNPDIMIIRLNVAAADLQE